MVHSESTVVGISSFLVVFLVINLKAIFSRHIDIFEGKSWLSVSDALTPFVFVNHPIPVFGSCTGWHLTHTDTHKL